jgi:hypothetical protein
LTTPMVHVVSGFMAALAQIAGFWPNVHHMSSYGRAGSETQNRNRQPRSNARARCLR